MAKPRLTKEEYLANFRQNGRNVVGTYIKGKGESFIIPDDDKLPQSIDVLSITDRGQTVISSTISGLKVVASFADTEELKVNIIEILGVATKVGTDVLSILRSHNLDADFPNDVLHEADRVAKISKAEIERREDLRKKFIITIDPADAKDLDDAVSLETNPDGTHELGVHIADVSQYIVEGGALDEEAFNRGTSVYFPGGVIPMLPVKLSNHICSLEANQDRLALSCFMTIDRQGRVTKSRISETVINVNQRFSYLEAQDILDGKTQASKQVTEFLKSMKDLTKTIEHTRRVRGEVTLNIPEPKIVLDETTGKIIDVVAYPHLMAHRIVETFMILANETIAQWALDHSLPFMYRIHEKPDPVKVARLVEMLKPFAIQHTIRENPTGHDYQRLLKNASEDLKPIISQLALRSMQKAKYSPECLGHFGLGSKYYCHFTSPIRRLPDLIIHRIIKYMLNCKLSSHKLVEFGDFVQKASAQAIKTELTATEVEREVDNLKRAEYMSERIGEQFSGTISGITEFGVFVYLANTVEGLVKIENMPKEGREFYRYNERTGTLSSNRRTFKMGDKIEVTCIAVNMSRRQIEFAAVQPETQPAKV